MHRALTILKYLPAALCGLLVVGLLASYSSSFGIAAAWSSTRRYVDLGLESGNIVLWTGKLSGNRPFVWHHYSRPPSVPSVGPFHFCHSASGGQFAVSSFPLLILVTVAMPLSLVPVTHFRFPLWSYFAWTALVAAELAYYLR
jgi:hypothetical protein